MVKNKSVDTGKGSKQDVESYCIQKAKECMVKGDSNLAKSWFLTASTLFPSSQVIRFERYLMARDEGNLADACNHLNQIFLGEQSSDPHIVAEMKKIVNAVKSSVNFVSISSFYHNLFHSFLPEAQYRLLLTVVNTCADLIESCELMLLIMKKFPFKISDHLPDLLQLISRAEKGCVKTVNGEGEKIQGFDFFDKLLVFDIFPVIFSKESNLTASSEILLSLLDRTVQYYIRSSVINVIVDEEQQTTELKNFTFEVDKKFDEVFNMFGQKLGWDLLVIEEHSAYGNFLSGVLLAQIQQIQTYYQKISRPSLSKENDGPIDLSSANIQPMECQDEEGLTHIFWAAFLLFIRCFNKYIQETVGKLILVEHGTSFKGDPLKKRKIYLKSSSPLVLSDNSELQENLIVSMQCYEFLNQDSNLQKEFQAKLKMFNILESRSFQIFKQDFMMYKGNHDECLSTLPESASSNIRSCLQLISSALMSYNYPLALKYSVEAVSRLHMLDEGKKNVNKSKTELSIFNSNASGRQIFFIAFSPSDILTYAIEVIIACLKDRVLLSPKPTDQGLGNLIVLTQYNWPKEVGLFLKCVSAIRKPTSGSPSSVAKFVYPHFCDYIFNPDILEEFMALVNSDGITIELKEQKIVTPQISKLSKSPKSMTTRRLGKNAKEEIKTALLNQMRRSKILVDDSIIIQFITSHLHEQNTML